MKELHIHIHVQYCSVVYAMVFFMLINKFKQIFILDVFPN